MEVCAQTDTEVETSMSNQRVDRRIPEYITAVEKIREGQYDVDLPVTPPDEVGRLGQALSRLALDVERRYHQTAKLSTITNHINAGLVLDDILDHVFEEFQGVIPYQRIGFSQIEQSEQGPLVRARWAKTVLPHVFLNRGYAAQLAGSTLETILNTGQPRIINDLAEYAVHKPRSYSTQLILSEGIRSSLTCPLIIDGRPVGFMFFSSTDVGAYQDAHVELFQQIAGQMSIMLEKGRMVSEIVDQRREIDRQNQELRRLNDLRNLFVGIVAHDLRNPLGNIQMAIDLLLTDSEGLNAETRQEILHEIRSQTRFMTTFLNDLLDISQSEAGKMRLEPTRFDLAPALADVVSHHQNLAAKKMTTVTLAEAPSTFVVADAGRIRQVLDNLISNAVKYSPPNSAVTVRLTHDATSWRVSVQDQGPGVTEADRTRLFQDFARLTARPTGGEKSTGLGLSIVRRIIEAHKGTVGVDNGPEGGAIFWFQLPLGS